MAQVADEVLGTKHGKETGHGNEGVQGYQNWDQKGMMVGRRIDGLKVT